MKMWVSCISLFALAALVSANCQAQDITIRLVDIRNGQVLANEMVSVQFHLPHVSELQSLEVKTGSDGVAKLRLPDPSPQKIAVLATMDRERKRVDLTHSPVVSDIRV
jgi:hypothetical protein